MKHLLVAGCGAAGALCRFTLAELAGARVFPVAILLVNVAGCFALGVVVTWAEGRWSPTAVAAAGAGFLGAFTTFSTFAADTVLLAERDRAGLAVLNVVLSVGLGLAAAWGGRAVAR